MLSVCIPVGPDKVYRDYLQECLDSLKTQTVPADEIVLIDDMAGISQWGLNLEGLNIRIHENPWICGVPHSFNFGVSLAKNDLVIMLGSDDKLYPWAIEDALKTWDKYKDPLGYYYFDIVYSDTGEIQRAANNCAMVTKELWRRTGGFPVQSAVGACDHIFLSMMMANGSKVGNIININSSKPPYWYRRHQHSATSNTNIWGAVATVRDWFTNNHKGVLWGRYA